MKIKARILKYAKNTPFILIGVVIGGLIAFQFYSDITDLIGNINSKNGGTPELMPFEMKDEFEKDEEGISKHSLDIAAGVWVYSTKQNQEELKIRYEVATPAEFIEKLAKEFNNVPAELAKGEAWVQRQKLKLTSPPADVYYEESDQKDYSNDLRDIQSDLDDIRNCQQFGIGC